MAAHGDVVYVLNTRDGGSIQGCQQHWLAVLAPKFRRRTAALGLEPNATPEFLTMPGQVAFTPEGGKLLVTTKGNTGAIEVFNVNPPHATPGAARVGAVVAATTVLRIAALAIVAVARLLAFRAGDVRPVRAHGGRALPWPTNACVITSATCRERSSRAWRCSAWRARRRCWGTVPQARLAESGAPPCEGDRSDRQCRGAEAVQRGALLILIRIPVYVRAEHHGGAPRGTDEGER